MPAPHIAVAHPPPREAPASTCLIPNLSAVAWLTLQHSELPAALKSLQMQPAPNPACAVDAHHATGQRCCGAAVQAPSPAHSAAVGLLPACLPLPPAGQIGQVVECTFEGQQVALKVRCSEAGQKERGGGGRQARPGGTLQPV